MNKILKDKSIFVIIIELLIILLGVIGITFATSKILNDRTQTVLKTGEYNVDYVGDALVNASNLEPVSDDIINIDTRDNVIRLEFSLRGVSTNKDDDKLIYDVMLSEMNIDCSLLNKYTKWRLYKNGKLLSDGSLDPLFDGNVLTDNMRLTTVQEDLPTYKDDYDKYVLLFWISESCDDLETCELVDQSNIVDSEMSMKVIITLYGGAKKKYERVANYDTACVSRPELYDNMIPVTYKNGKFVVANKDNSNKDNIWYDYGNQIWANAVVVKNNNNYNVSDEIPSDNILAYYVWIPKFSYKLWNASLDRSDTYNAYDNGIEITFDSKNVNVNEYKNDMFILHPAFNNINGFWISKYEVSVDNDIYKFIPSVDSYANDTLENYKVIMDLLKENYSLGDNVESSIVNNLEWGATLYLSHSKYGVCSHDGCDSILVNNTKIIGSNKQDTTTRNVYGVYDMAGAASEYVIGKYDIGSATKEIVLSGGDGWYRSGSTTNYDDYLLRGGIGTSLFYYGYNEMGNSVVSSRSILKSK